jgi:hypothetical protein
MGSNTSEELAGSFFKVEELSQTVQAVNSIEKSGYKHSIDAHCP